MDKIFDFSGYATKNNLQCSDGRTIMHNAFKDDDGKKVPLVWNHDHNTPDNILGHAVLENRNDGVYAYCSFNETTTAKEAKELIKHGDISALSIYANKLKQNGKQVIHGAIKEVSLVIAGANPGAYIEEVLLHNDNSDDSAAVIFTGEDFEIYHSDTKKTDNTGSDNMAKNDGSTTSENDKTIQDVIDTMTEEQKTALYATVGMAIENNNDMSHSDMYDEGDEEMKQNVFDKETSHNIYALTHSDRMAIISNAKNASCGTLQNALAANDMYDEAIQHGFENIDQLFPDFANLKPGAPELIDVNQKWVAAAMNKVHKSPMSRIRTRQVDISQLGITGKGHKKGTEKTDTALAKLVKRTTEPTTVYEKDSLHRDDIIDITDFDVVAYQYDIMRIKLNESIMVAVMLGDGRDEMDEDKIDESKIRPIWTDDEVYTIHKTVDIETMRTELQGTNTAANFGENYIYTEAIIEAALRAREDYHGSGSLDFYSTQNIINTMTLAKDLNGRRVYANKAELASALNVDNIYEVEQFANKTRTDADGDEYELLGIFVNMNDYNIGATKGGEITKFNQFDIDFNKEKMLLETRISGALTSVKSAIVLEKPVENPLG